MSWFGGRFLLGTLAVAVVTLFVAGALAQSPAEDDRNKSQQYFDAVNGGKCFAHHEPQGFLPFGYGLRQRYAELPIGQVYPLTMRVWHNSVMGHTVQQISVVVNTTNAPNVQVITNETLTDVERDVPVTLVSGGAPHKERIDVLDGASEMMISATLGQPPTGSQVGLAQGELTMSVVTPSDRELDTKGGRFDPHVALAGDQLRNMGFGEYQVSLSWDSDVDQEVEVAFEVRVKYSSDQTEFVFRAPTGTRIPPGGDPVDVVIPIQLVSDEVGVIDFRVQAVDFWPHEGKDGAPRDDGLFYRFTTMKVKGGTTEIQASVIAPQPVAPAVDLFNIFTRILGFAAALLIPISMLTGGIFGKRSRRWMNKVTGGAKKRVLWHSAMSWMIVAVASFHFVIALIEVKFLWTKGLLWGGLGWALLVSLGFTGYYQVRMIKRWNYKVWRHTHLWSAAAVLVFTLVHLVLDGSDLVALRDMLPDWHERLILP